ncbi:MAG: hypothetical protein QW648_01095 [Nanoarchaeales archaeon]
MIKILNDVKIDYLSLVKLRVGLTPIYVKGGQLKYLEDGNFLILDFESKKIELTNERVNDKKNKRVLKLKNFSQGKAFLLHVSTVFALFSKFLFIDLKNKTFELFDNYVEMNKYIIHKILKDLLTEEAYKVFNDKISNDEMAKLLYERVINYIPDVEKKNINIRLMYSKAILLINKIFNIAVWDLTKHFDVSYETVKRIIKKINIYI